MDLLQRLAAEDEPDEGDGSGEGRQDDDPDLAILVIPLDTCVTQGARTHHKTESSQDGTTETEAGAPRIIGGSWSRGRLVRRRTLRDHSEFGHNLLSRRVTRLAFLFQRPQDGFVDAYVHRCLGGGRGKAYEMKRIKPEFFERDPATCARELIGCVFLWKGKRGVIVETKPTGYRR